MQERSAFTLVELVVVVMILGILATVAAPKLLSTSGAASDNALKQTLSIVRKAIELYAAEHSDSLPGADKNELTFKADLQAYLRAFPENPQGANPAKLDRVKMRDNGNPLGAHVDNDEGWIYDCTTGEFRANNDAMSSDGATRYSEF